MSTIKIEISVEEALNLLKKVDDKKEFLTLFGGRRTFIKDCINLFLENGTLAFDFRETFNEILFEESDDNETYKDVWNEFWDDGLYKLPLNYLVESMIDYKPGRRSDDCADAALDYILDRYFNVSKVDRLKEEQIDELYNIFDNLDDIPSEFKEYKEYKEFVQKLLEFKDQEYIQNNYAKMSGDTKEWTELFCKVVSNNVINVDNLELFCSMVEYHSPRNQLSRPYRKLFILTIFEAGDWSEEEYKIFDEYFYNIDFEEGASNYENMIDDSIHQEAKHISEQLKINPNYRHD